MTHPAEKDAHARRLVEELRRAGEESRQRPISSKRRIISPGRSDGE